MPSYFQDVDDRRIGSGATVPYSEEDFPASFPLSRWNYQLDRYIHFWNMFAGEWLRELMPESIDDKGQAVLRYPLQINYLKKACMVHSYALFGEVNDTPGPLVPIRIKARKVPGKKRTDEKAKVRAEELENFINRVWIDNHGRSLQQDAGLVQQFLGGIVFRISYDPANTELEYGIRLEYILPDFFLPIWDTGRPDDLFEAWVVYRMPSREASMRFGFPLDGGNSDPLYIEHWTRDEVTITLGGKPIEYTVKGISYKYDKLKNPFGYVPFVYIPRERAGSYYGLSLLDDTPELAKEMNARVADNSDIIEETSHRDTYMRNVNISPRPTDIGGTRPAINLGQTTPGSNPPEVFAIDPPPLNDAMVKHVEYLRQQFGRDMFIPGIAEGEDEGSQRSGLTLAFRMWPLTSKLKAVRTYWTTGMIIVAKFIARMAIEKGIGDITADHLKDIDWGVHWSPMIPRDREADLNEAAIGIQSNMIAPAEGNQLLNLSDDADEASEEVMEWLTFLKSLEAQQQDSTTSDPAKGTVKVQTKTQPIATIMQEPGES